MIELESTERLRRLRSQWETMRFQTRLEIRWKASKRKLMKESQGPMKGVSQRGVWGRQKRNLNKGRSNKWKNPKFSSLVF